MRRNYIVDTVLLVLSILLGISGLAMWENSSRSHRARFFRQKTLATKRAPWCNVHRFASLIFVSITVLHLIWHWRWISDCTPRVLHWEE